MKKKYLNSICLLVLVVFGNLMQAQKSKKQAANVKTSAYLFAYFTGNDIKEESVHFAVSNTEVAMVTKLAGHSAFQGAAADRLKMCSDCRVIDLYSASDEQRITDL